MKKIRFAVIGTGFWASYQVAGWMEIPGLELIAVCDPDHEKALAFANRFNVAEVYTDAAAMLQKEKPDFVDIITSVEAHAPLVKLAADHGIAVVCQKPMTDSLATAEELVRYCSDKKVPFFIHENFRFQSTIRVVKQLLDEGIIGKVFKARISFCSGFPVFVNQPALAKLPRFILTDIGSHILDLCRFLFGEVKTLFALTQKVNPVIDGEDVADVLMQMQSGVHCFAEMSYATVHERDYFPNTLLQVEGDSGSVVLNADNELRVTTKNGKTTVTKINPPAYSWANPDYALIHASIVDCNRDILKGLTGAVSELTATDNLETVRLVWDSYLSADTGQLIRYQPK
jgi:D-apiose dehydrogenase